MPLSADNPNRNRNYVIAVVAGTTIFCVIMLGFITLRVFGSGDQDSDAYVRFLTLLITGLVPGLLSVWYSFKAHSTATEVRSDIQDGVLKDKVKEGVAEVLTGDAAKVEYSGGTAITPSVRTDNGKEDVT